MLQKSCVIDQLEVVPSGHLQIRIQKRVSEGAIVLLQEPHRTVVEPGQDVGVQFAAVNEHLAAMSWPAVSDADVARATAVAAAAWTPEVLAAWEALKQAAESEQ